MKSKGIRLNDHAVSGEAIIKKVILSTAAKREAEGRIKALERQCNELLDEFTAYRNARPVPRAPSKPRDGRADIVRIIAGDLHGMRQDPAAVSAFLADLKTWDPDEVVFLGDMLDCEGWLATHHTIGFVANCDYSYAEDSNGTNDFLDRAQDAAPHASFDYLFGNHDDRVERAIVDLTLGHRLDSATLMELWGPAAVLRLADRGITAYKRDQIYVDGLPRGWIRKGKMCFTHDLGAKGKNAARDAVAKSAVNVTFGHTHRADSATIVFPGVGICKAFNPGCLCHMQPIYMHSDPTSWSQGYDVDFVAKSGNFQRISVPIWRGESLAGAMIERFKS